jgi:hypothetical protein
VLSADVHGGEVRSDFHSVEALLRLATTQKNNRASRRILGIAHALGGMTISAAARAAGMEPQALGDAIKRYNAVELEGLFHRAKPGRLPGARGKARRFRSRAGLRSLAIASLVSGCKPRMLQGALPRRRSPLRRLSPRICMRSNGVGADKN